MTLKLVVTTNVNGDVFKMSSSKEMDALRSKLDAALAESARWKKELDSRSEAKSSLEKEMETVRKELKTRDGLIERLAEDAGTRKALEGELKRFGAERKRIKLVPSKSGASKHPETNGKGSTPHNSHVVETLRSGNVY